MVVYSFTVGLMGAIYGGKPVSILIETYSWQTVAITLSAISIAIGFATFFILRSPTATQSSIQENQFKLANFKALLSSPIIWCLACANLLMVGSLEGFADVWGIPYLMQAYNLNKSDAAGLVSLVFFGMLFGGPLLALCSKKFGNYPVITVCGLGMALAFSILLSNHAYNWLLLSCLLFAIGVMCCYQVIVFAAGADLVAPQNLGVTVAFLNCINMLGGSFFHTSIGKIMDLFWTGTLRGDGLKIYDLGTYKYALSIIPLCAVAGAAMICLLGIAVKRKRDIQM